MVCCSLSCSQFLVGDSPSSVALALMILPDDTVLNISASSAHMYTLKGRGAFICLCGPLKTKQGKRKHVSFTAIVANLHFMKPQNTDNQEFPRAEQRVALCFTVQMIFAYIWSVWTRKCPFIITVCHVGSCVLNSHHVVVSQYLKIWW